MKSDFEVEYVPPDQFGEKEWYEPMRNGIRWFYHRPRTRPLPVDPEALDGTLDAGIVPVVAAARAQGLATLPSCAGHSVDVVHTLLLHEQLTRDAEEVRGIGLPLLNVETGEKVLWQDPAYYLSWDEPEELEADLRVRERVGAIGIRGPQSHLAHVARRLLTVPFVHLSEKGGDLWIWVRAPTQTWQDATWLRVAEKMNA
jgi:hypothetical protein